KLSQDCSSVCSMSLDCETPSHHIAVVTRAFEGGCGPERDTVLLCNALAAKGVRVTILVLRDQGPLRSLLDPAVRVVVVPGRRMRYAVPGLRRVIRALAPRLVLSSGISNLPTLLAMRTLRARRRPKLVLREVSVPSMAHHDPYRANWFSYL